MAHQVEQMAYVGKTPWHSLGNQLAANQPIEVWQKQAGMDWHIKSSPVQFMDTVDDTQSSPIIFPQSKVLYHQTRKHRFLLSASDTRSCSHVKSLSFIAI